MTTKQLEIIGFMIQGENVIVANPCTIPIDMLQEAISKERKKNEISACCMIKIPLPKGFKK